MEKLDTIWNLFETTGSIEAYISYSMCCNEAKEKEEPKVGSCANNGDCYKGNQIR